MYHQNNYQDDYQYNYDTDQDNYQYHQNNYLDNHQYYRDNYSMIDSPFPGIRARGQKNCVPVHKNYESKPKIGEVKTDKMADTDRITMETIKENGDVDGRQEGQGGDTEEASDELWDIFRKDRFDDDSSMFHGFTDKFFKVIKLLTYGFLFLAPLASVIATRGTLQILTNIIGNEQYYGKESVSQDVVSYFLFFIITIPDALRFLKTLLQVIFGKRQTPTLGHLLTVLIREIGHVIGLFGLLYKVAPSLNPLEFTVVIVTIPAVIGFVHAVAYCGRRRKTEYGWNTRKIVKQLLNLVAMFLLLGLLIGVPVIITQNSTVISSKAEFIGWEIASVVLLSTRWIETYSSRNIGKKGCSIPITENQRLARSSDTRIHSIERKMTDSPKSTPNRESHSEEGGPIHGKTVDEDDSNWTTIKPSTEAVGQEIRCSFDKDSLSSRADQNDDNSENSNSKVKFCEKKSDDIHPTCDDTTTDNNAVAVATSNVKGSNKEPTDQGDNREQTNLKDGGNETKNVEVTSETYIGNKNNGMEENASNDEDNSKGTTSKPSTEVVGQEKSCSFDKDSSPSRADQGDNRERVNLKDGENRINNVEVTSETNIGYENNGMEENASNDEDNSKGTTIKPSTEDVGKEKSCSFDKDSSPSRADQGDNRERVNLKDGENRINNVEVTSETNIGDENNGMEENASDDEDNSKGTTSKPSTEEVGREKSCSFDKHSSPSRADQGDKRERVNLENGENRINNVEVTSETNIGDENNGMEENASNDEDNSKGTTSKPSTEDVGQEKSCSFDKDSSPSRADQGDNRERVNLKNGENRINNVEVTSETNIGDENNGMEENASNDEDNSKGTTIKPSTEDVGKEKSCSFDKDSSPSRADQGDNRERVNLKDGENRINNVEVTSETNIGDENNGMEENASDDEDNSKGTTSKPSTEEVGREKSCSFDKHSSPSRADQGDKRERVNLENGENRINNVEVTSETNIGDENNGMEENASNDEDNSKGTTSKPSTEDVGQEKSCSFDKDSSPSRADQGDNRERVNLKNGENRINNVEVTSETNIGDENNGMEENASNDEDNSKGTTIKPSTEDVGKEKSCSFDKDSSPSRADQGDNREQTNMKDGQNRINNVEVTTETYIGDENNGMEENASNDEDNSKGTTSKPSTEVVGREKSFRFDKDSSSSRAHEKDENDESNWNIDADKCQNSSDEQVADIDLKSNAKNKAEKIKKNISEVQNALKQSHSSDSPSMERVKGLRRPREDTTKKLVDDIKQSRETEKQTKIQAEVKSVRQTSNSKYDEKKSEDVHPPSDGTLIGNTEEDANSNEKGSNEAPVNQGENRKLTYLKDGENEINNVKISSETNIGESYGSSLNDDMETGETETSNENSKDPGQIVSALDLNGTGIRYENCTERNEVIENKPPINHDETFKREDNFHHSRDIKEEKMLHDNDGRRCPRLKKPDEEEYVTDGNEHDHYNKTNQRHYQHSLEGFKSTLPPCNIENNRETEEISVSYGEDILWDGQEKETSKDDFPGTHSQEFQVGTPRFNAQTGEYVHSHPFIQGGLQIYQPNANGFNQHFDNDDNDQVGIGINLPAAGGPSSPNDPDRDRHRNELIAKDIQIAELKAQTAYLRMTERENKNAIVNTEYEKTELLAQIADLRIRERRNKDAIVNTEYEKNSLRKERDEARRTINTLTMAKDGLIDDITRLEENIRILEERLHTTEEDNVTKDANIDTIRSRNSELQTNCDTLRENLTAAKDKCISLEENIRILEERLHTTEEDNVTKDANIDTIRSRNSELQTNCETLRENLTAAKDKCISLEENIRILEERLHTTEEDNVTKDANIDTIRSRNSELQTNCETLRENLTAAKDKCISLEENIRILEERLHTTEEDNVTKDANIDTIRSRNSELQTNCETLRENLTAAKDKCISLEENIRILEERLHTTEEDNVTKDANIDTIRSRNSELQTNCETLRENLTAAKDKCISLEENIRILEERLHTTEEDNVTKDANIAELLAQIADLRIRERRNKDAIVNTEYEKNSLRRERDEARRTISTLTMTKDGLIDDVTGLEENIRILEERLHTTEEDNVTKDANIDTIRSRNSELQTNCETLRENLTAAKNKCISLEANQRRLDEKVQCLEKDLEKQAEENTAKSAEISSLKESCGALKESEIRHRGECDKLRKAYEEEKDKTRFMEDRMNSLSGRVDTLEAETEQKDRMIHRKESARQAANEAMQKSQDENQVLCEQLRDLQSLQVQLEQEKAKNHAATEQLIALRQQLSGMDTMQRNIHIWWEEYRLAMNERTQEKADYETCRRRLQTLESELVYVKEERDSLRETTRVDQIEKDRLNAHKHDLTTKLQNQVGQITNMSEEVRNRREAMDTYRREKENLKDRSFELERILLTAERQIEGLKRDDRDRDILNLRAQLSDVSDPRDGDGDNGGPGHGSGGHGNQGGSTPGETNSGQQGFFPNTQSSTVHHRPQTPSNSVGLRGQQSQGTPTSSIFGISMPTSFTFATPSSSSTPLPQHLSGNQGGPSFFTFGSQNSTA